jgi:hypothetical protein
VVAIGINGAREAAVAKVVLCRVGTIEEMRKGARSRRRGVRWIIPAAAARDCGIRRATWVVIHGEGVVLSGTGTSDDL